VDGGIWVVLGNLNSSYGAAGNTFLANYALTGAATLHELPGCANGAAVISTGSQLLVPCASDYAATDGTAVLFDPASNSVVATYATGGAPTLAAVSGTHALLADGLGGSVLVIDVAVDGGHGVLIGATAEQPVCSGTQTLNAVASGPSSTQVLGVCGTFGGSVGGNLVVMDSSGSLVAGTTLGLDEGPVAISYLQTVQAGTPYDLFGVVNTTSDDIQLVSWPSGGQAVSAGLKLGAGSSVDGANAIAAAGGVGYVVLSETADPITPGELIQLDLTTTPPTVKATAYLPPGSDPYGVAAIDAHTAWVSLLDANQVAIVQFP
jgi:hypothetical protein